jgi:ribosomal protein L24
LIDVGDLVVIKLSGAFHGKRGPVVEVGSVPNAGRTVTVQLEHFRVEVWLDAVEKVEPSDVPWEETLNGD